MQDSRSQTRFRVPLPRIKQNEIHCNTVRFHLTLYVMEQKIGRNLLVLLIPAYFNKNIKVSFSVDVTDNRTMDGRRSIAQQLLYGSIIKH